MSSPLTKQIIVFKSTTKISVALPHVTYLSPELEILNTNHV